MEKFEKLSLDKFKNQELSDISKLFGGTGMWTTNCCTKATDKSDTGHPDAPSWDPA